MLGSGYSICGEMAGYPLDTVSRRMMMTSGAVRPMLGSGYSICGEMAGYPLDTVSRRMMMSSGAVKYKGTLHAIAHNLTTEGEKSFYSGSGAHILGCVVAAYTEVLKEGSSLTITW
ncbi:hypothetical protein Gotri_003347 [Gossypium trilobum]|uniref:ADP/ATP translocase n=1 Tax=Gossypium trilobum TaxID=34281 RepID=A0A7J9F376_9ROSI|nr:hypothetical protein [Gossypium trilobum]